MSKHTFLSSKILPGDGAIREQHHNGLITLVFVMTFAMLGMVYYTLVIHCSSGCNSRDRNSLVVDFETIMRERIAAEMVIVETKSASLGEEKALAVRESILKRLQ